MVNFTGFWFGYSFLALLTSFFFALMEIQIEGEHGWAAKLPTWRKLPKWLKGVFGKHRPLTGYHLYLWLFLTSLTHLAVLFTNWSLGKELILISFIVLVVSLEDFFWFVLNPHFGLKKFKQQFIAWHPHWFLRLPRVYWFALGLIAVLIYSGLKLG